MTEEIEEILNDDIPIFVIDSDGYTINITETIHNIITNLQQENEKLKQTLHNITINGVEEENTTVLDLINENETLKEQNNDLRKIYRNTYKRLFENGNDELAHYFQAQIDDCPTFYVEPIIDYTKEYKVYKSRCEKANKWVDKHTETYTKNGISIIDWDNLSDPRKLKNILNGSDENE